MPAPLGKHREMISGRAPWNVPNVSTESQRKVKKTPQAEIDLCLYCEKESCQGNCKKIHDFDRAQRLKYRPAPKEFLDDVKSGKFLVSELAEKYGVSEHMTRRWRKEAGLIISQYVAVDMEKFERDVRSGMTLKDIKARHHIGSDRAKKLFAQIGISPPNHISQQRKR